MKEEILKDLFCIQCCLKFDKKVWYDLHLSLVHGHENKTEVLEKKVKREQEDKEIPID